MLKIEYKMNQRFDDYTITPDIASCMGESDFQYDVFTGNVIIQDANLTLDIDWEWVTLLAFSLTIIQVCKNMANSDHKEKSLRFTENEATIKFIRRGQSLLINPDFQNITLESTFDEFVKETRNSSIKLMSEIMQTYPFLLKNKVFLSYYNTVHSF